jgi:uncharacterized protein YjbJ (UPF0337 family)
MPEKEQITGKLKETEGKLTGDESREQQGKDESTWGDAKDKVKGTWDDIKD